jgi:hypothetical protein
MIGQCIGCRRLNGLFVYVNTRHALGTQHFGGNR